VAAAIGTDRGGYAIILASLTFATHMTFFQENWVLIVVAFVSGAMLVWPLVQRGFSPMKAVGTLAATHLINTRDALLLDLREAKDFQGGRLPNSLHVPISQLASRSTELAKHVSRPVIAYCDNGSRSRTAGVALANAGFSEVYQLSGGLKAWRDAGLPVEKIA
jgi:rhodanese-related sulfurtransferase